MNWLDLFFSYRLKKVITRYCYFKLKKTEPESSLSPQTRRFPITPLPLAPEKIHLSAFQFQNQLISCLHSKSYEKKSVPSQMYHDPILPALTCHEAHLQQGCRMFGSKLDLSFHSQPESTNIMLNFTIRS